MSKRLDPKFVRMLERRHLTRAEREQIMPLLLKMQEEINRLRELNNVS